MADVEPLPADFNPYATPLSAVSLQSDEVPFDRSGPVMPPWEAAGAVGWRFFSTIARLMASPSMVFRRMDPAGSWIAPLAFFLICTVVMTFAVVGQELVQDAWNEPASSEEALPKFAAMVLIGVPVNILTLFGVTLVCHASLFILGGATNGLKASFRAIAYSMAIGNLAGMIPTAGSVMNVVVCIWLIIIGLKQVQRISILKAIIAALLPFVLLIGGVVTVLFALDAAGIDWKNL